MGTDQLCLIEYFGSHDFGWCKTEQIVPYIKGEDLVVPPDSREEGVYIDKVVADSYAIDEANSSFEYYQVRVLMLMLVLIIMNQMVSLELIQLGFTK